MPSRNTSDSLLSTNLTVASSLVVQLNETIRAHYPPGEVDYAEVLRSLASLGASYRRAGIELGLFDEPGPVTGWPFERPGG